MQKISSQTKKKEDQGKSGEIVSRFNDVKVNYKQLFTLQRERMIEFISNSKAYKIADERIHIQDKFERSRAFTCGLYESLSTQVIVPVQDKMFLIYDSSLQKASIVVENIQSGTLAQNLSEKYSDAKVTLSNNWMKLDLNNDGKVTISDLITAVRSIRQIISQSQIYDRAFEIKDSVSQRAIKYWEGESTPADSSNKEVPLVKNGDDSASIDSIEMQNMSEKDD